jgi:TetR/AcrR family transcriptional repressor of nem operon
LRAYIDNDKNRLNQESMKNGCLLGNFVAESGECSEAVRLRLVDAFAQVQAALAYCLHAAVKAGEIPAATDCDEIAAFIVSSLQGATLLAKAQRSPVPVERFEKVLFASVLGRIGQADPAS